MLYIKKRLAKILQIITCLVFICPTAIYSDDIMSLRVPMRVTKVGDKNWSKTISDSEIEIYRKIALEDIDKVAPSYKKRVLEKLLADLIIADSIREILQRLSQSFENTMSIEESEEILTDLRRVIAEGHNARESIITICEHIVTVVENIRYYEAVNDLPLCHLDAFSTFLFYFDAIQDDKISNRYKLAWVPRFNYANDINKNL